MLRTEWNTCNTNFNHESKIEEKEMNQQMEKNDDVDVCDDEQKEIEEEVD